MPGVDGIVHVADPFQGVFGARKVSYASKQIALQFSYGLNANDLATAVTVQTGAASADRNGLKVTTGTNAAGECLQASRKTTRYVPGGTMELFFTAQFTTPVANSEQWAGLKLGDDFILFGYNGTALTFKYGNSVTPANSDSATTFNGANFSGLDFTKANLFRLTFGYLGIAPIKLQVLRPETDNSWLDVHTFRNHGEISGTHIGNPFLPFVAWVKNSGNTTAINLHIYSVRGSVYATDSEGSPRSFSRAFLSTGNRITTSAWTNLVTYRNKTTYAGRTNAIAGRLAFLSWLAYNGTGLIELRILANPGVTGFNTSWTDVSTANSTWETNTQAVTWADADSGCLLSLADYIEAGTGNKPSVFGGGGFDFEKLGLIGYPGEHFAIVAKKTVGTGTADAWVSPTHLELF